MGSPAIRLSGVSFSYPDGVEALRDVGFDVAEGESVGIVGPNGAGKSTLTLLLAGFLPPRDGIVEVAGIRVGRSTVREVRRRLGLVFEDPEDQLFMGTLYDDVAFGPMNMGVAPDRVDEIVRGTLAMVGLDTLADRFPGHLSSGQKRAAAIAAVIAMRPAIVVFDEPTAGLDPRSRRRVIEIIGALGGSRIVVSHDLEAVLDCCRRVILLDGGRIVADGPAENVLSDGALLDAHGLEKPHSLMSASEHRHVHAMRLGCADAGAPHGGREAAGDACACSEAGPMPARRRATP